MTRYETVEITDPKDWKVGDLFEGTHIKERDGYRVETRMMGPLQQRPHLSRGLFVDPNLPYVTSPYFTGSRSHWESQWTNVRVTREVEVPPSLEETLEALPNGSVVFNQDHRNTDTGRGTWTFNKKHGWWVSAMGFEKDSASFANFLREGGYSYKIVNRDEVEV